MAEPEQDLTPRVDYRFLLANERTFLAYVRTALSLHIAGLGVLQFLTNQQQWSRELLGGALIVTGSFLGGTGYLRFRSNERTIRAGGEMATSRTPLVVTLGVTVVPLLAALVIIVG